MADLRKTHKIKDLTNDIISSIELKPDIPEGKNCVRVKMVSILIQAHAGLADGDYIILDFEHKDLNGDALADLSETIDDDYIERQFFGVEMLGTNGPFVRKLDPAKGPIFIYFKQAILWKNTEYLNVLVHGLAAARDAEIVIYGVPANVGNLDDWKKGLKM